MNWLYFYPFWLLFLIFTTSNFGCRYLTHKKDSVLSATVVRVADGDTIEIVSNDVDADNSPKKRIKVRLFGIDAPEIGQSFGKNSHNYAKKLLLGKKITLNIKETDQYGRFVAIVTLPNGQVAQENLLGNGYAWWYKSYAPYEHNFAIAQAKAQKENKGLWAKSDKKLMPPWQWRLNQRLLKEGRLDE